MKQKLQKQRNMVILLSVCVCVPLRHMQTCDPSTLAKGNVLLRALDVYRDRVKERRKDLRLNPLFQLVTIYIYVIRIIIA